MLGDENMSCPMYNDYTSGDVLKSITVYFKSLHLKFVNQITMMNARCTILLRIKLNAVNFCQKMIFTYNLTEEIGCRRVSSDLENSIIRCGNRDQKSSGSLLQGDTG